MQDLSNTINEDLFERYFKGAASNEEIKLVRQWFGEHNLKDQLSVSSAKTWETIPLNIEIQELDGARILDRIHHMINRGEAPDLRRIQNGPTFLRYLSRIAAIIVLPLLLTTFLLYQKIHTIYKETPYAEIYAPAGTRTTFNLPDGSSGWLNGGSTIKFPTHFSGKTRNVELIGEAYLNVIKDSRKAFIVTTSKIEVKVYGTSFNVMAYADDQRTEVTLESGMVEVFKKRGEITQSIGKLKPDQSLTYFHDKDHANLVSLNSSDKTSWIEGKLLFRYEPFCDVIQKINRWYNVDIVIKDQELKDHNYYGTFQDETLEEVLKLLKLTAPIRYKDLGREKLPDGTYEKRKIELYNKK
jgi:ferric-dicitrate binding protein FerR (iron transport regulator)